MNVLVTGGAGYIGSSLVELLDLMDEIETIYVLDNLSHSPLSFFLGKNVLKKVRFIKGDILDSYVLDKIIGEVEIVYHLAGYVSLPYNYSQNVQFEQINKWGTLNLVRCIQQSSHKIREFIYLSSFSVYGLRGNIKMNEETQPSNAYGQSKLEGEKFVQLLANSCKVHIVRSANVYGFNTNFRADSVLNHFIFHAITDKKILMYGNGAQQRPFVSLNNLNALLISIAVEKEENAMRHAIDFNADLNDIKNWLMENHVPDLEYSYINSNVNYDGQFIEDISGLSELNKVEIDTEFDAFKRNLRIHA